MLTLTQVELTRLRALANGVVAREAVAGRGRFTTTVKLNPSGARVHLVVQAGTPMPADPLARLGDVCDLMATELRLERNPLGLPAFRTHEPLFEGGDTPEYWFDVTRLGDGEE